MILPGPEDRRSMAGFRKRGIAAIQQALLQPASGPGASRIYLEMKARRTVAEVDDLSHAGRGFALAVTLDSRTGTYCHFGETDLEALWLQLRAVDLVIAWGWLTTGRVLLRDHGYNTRALRVLDLQWELWLQSGRDWTLDEVAHDIAFPVPPMVEVDARAHCPVERMAACFQVCQSRVFILGCLHQLGCDHGWIDGYPTGQTNRVAIPIFWQV